MFVKAHISTSEDIYSEQISALWILGLSANL